jgi:hypothetical protein
MSLTRRFLIQELVELHTKLIKCTLNSFSSHFTKFFIVVILVLSYLLVSLVPY